MSTIPIIIIIAFIIIFYVALWVHLNPPNKSPLRKVVEVSKGPLLSPDAPECYRVELECGHSLYTTRADKKEHRCIKCVSL